MSFSLVKLLGSIVRNNSRKQTSYFLRQLKKDFEALVKREKSFGSEI